MPRGRGGKYFGPPLPYIQQVFFSICVPLHVVPTSSPPRARRQRFRAQSPFDLRLNTAARRQERAIGGSEDEAPNEREVNDDDGVVSDYSLPSPDQFGQTLWYPRGLWAPVWKSLKNLSKVSQKSFKSRSIVFQKSLKSCSKVSQKSLKSLSKDAEKSPKSLSKVSQKSLKSLSKVAQ